MALTTKELLLIKDNIKMCQDSVKFLQGCSEMVTDSQIKSLCSQMVSDHERDVSILIKHVSSDSIQ